MAVLSSPRSLKDCLPLSHAYPQFRAEDSVLYSRWIYGNNTARLIAWVRNSQLSKAAYTPNGQVQNQGYRVLYGISLTATTVIGLCLDTIQNFLAICSIYYLGKKIWEYRNSQGAFSPNALAINPASKEVGVEQVQLEASKDLANTGEFKFTYDPNRWTSVLYYLHFYPNLSSLSNEQMNIFNEKCHLIRLLRRPTLSVNVKQALYSYFEALTMNKLKIGLSIHLSGSETDVPLRECVEWVVCLRDALSNISLPEDPLKKLKIELEAELIKKERELLSDLSLDDSRRKSRYEDVKKRYKDVFHFLDTLSTMDYWNPISSVPDQPKEDEPDVIDENALISKEQEVLKKLHIEITEFWKQKEAQFLSNPSLNGDPEKRSEFEAEKEKFRAILDPSSVRENPSPVAQATSSARQEDPDIINLELG